MRGNALRWAVALAITASVLLVVPPGAPAGAHDASQGPSPADGPGPRPAAFVPFAPNVRVNTVNLGYDYEVEPTMVIDSAGKIYVGWKEAPTPAGGGERVGFAYSADRGDTFSTNILMPVPVLSYQSDPWLTVTRDDRVYFTRIEYASTSQPGGISVTNTTDGVTWGTTYYRSDAPNFADKESAAHDAAGNLYWVWNSDSSRQVLAFSRSNDGGASWTPNVIVSDGPGTLGGIVQVHPNGTVLAAWWQYSRSDILFDRSFDGGLTWGPDIRVNDIPGSAESPLPSDPPVLPSMAVAPNGTIYVAWEDYRNGRPGGTPNGDMDIMASHSSDGGTTWSPAVRVNDDATTARQWMPDLAIDRLGGVHAAWEDDRTGNHNIYYANSTDGGTTFGPNVRVTTAETPVSYTRPGDYLAIESSPDGTVCVVWTDGRGPDLDINFARLERTVAVTIDTVPAGLNVVVDGLQGPAPRTFSWRPGSTHDLAAPSPQASGPQSRRVFASWDDGGGPSHTVTVGNASRTIVASYDTEHQVTVRTSPTPLDVRVNGATFSGAVMQWWREGDPHAIEAPSPQGTGPGTRYVFDAWSDGGSESHDANVSAPRTFDASFREQFLLQVVSSHGTPTGGGWYEAADTAAFSVDALVAGGTGTQYLFEGWSGDSTGTAPAGTIGMDGPRTVTATWRTQYLLTVVSPYGTPQGGGWYDAGTPATATVPDTVTVGGTVYRFAGWTGDSTSASSAVLVPMDGPKTITATWTVVPAEPPSGAAVDVLPWILLAIVIGVIGVLILVVLWRRRRKRGDEPRPPSSAS